MNPHEHIVKSFDSELQKLGERISNMGELAAEQVVESVAAVVEGDEGRTEAALERDSRIDGLELEATEVALRLLALRSPMAVDLREVVAAIKIASDLERIGDLAKNVAKRAHVLGPAGRLQGMQRIAGLGEIVKERIDAVIRAYRDRDAVAAAEVWRRDREVDDGYHGIFRESLTYMMEDARSIGVYTHLLFVAKNLERIGDHCANIAASVHYLVEGRSLEEARPKGEDTAYTVVEPFPGA